MSVPEVCPDGSNECSTIISLKCEPKTCNSVQPTIHKWSVNFKGDRLFHFCKKSYYDLSKDNWQYADKALTKDQSVGPYDQRCRTPCSQDKCFYMIDDQDTGVPGQSGFCDPNPTDIPKGD